MGWWNQVILLKSYWWADDTRYDDDTTDRLGWVNLMVNNGLRWFEMVWDGLNWFDQQEARRDPSTSLAYILPPSPLLQIYFVCLFVCLFICKSYSENIVTHAHTFLMKLPATTGYGLKEQTSSALLYHNLSSCKTEANMVWLLIIDSTINSVFQLFTHPHILPQLSRSPEHSLAPRRTLRSL